MSVVLVLSQVMNFAHAADDRVEVIDLRNASAPDAELDSGGSVHVAYLSDNDIYYVTSGDGGASFSEPVRVNAESGLAGGGLFRGPDLAVGKDGRIHVAWYNNFKRPRNEWGLRYSRMNEDRTGFEPVRILSSHRADGYSLAADANGNVAAVWVDEGLFVSLSGDGGTTFSPPVLTRPEPCECCQTRSLYAPGGDLFYLYRDRENNDRDMYLDRHGDDGDLPFPVKLNAETWHIDACPISGDFLAGIENDLLAAWESTDGVYFSRLNQQGGITRPGEVKVSGSGKFPVVLGNAKELLVAWKQGRSLYWQLYDINGNRQGAVNSLDTSQSAGRPGGVVLNDGKFLLFP